MTTTEDKVHNETMEVKGEDLLGRIKELVHEGNVRRIIIKNEDGDRLVEIPLTLGVVGALLLPQLTAIGALAAVVARCTIEVERAEEGDTETTAS